LVAVVGEVRYSAGMPQLEFHGKQIVYAHHLSVPYRTLDIGPGQIAAAARRGGGGRQPDCARGQPPCAEGADAPLRRARQLHLH